ncbi:MAG TPA: SDR family NAD(P)-dependent oxidoreductase, partial [Spongiibacteraceae bacterium]
MNVDLNNRVAIVTGAARGVGAVYARALAQNGARVVLADLNADAVETTTAQLRVDGFDASGFAVDIADPVQTQKLANFAQQQYGGVDILVNNAAFMQPIAEPLLTYPLELWRATMDINVSGTLHCIRAIAP